MQKVHIEIKINLLKFSYQVNNEVWPCIFKGQGHKWLKNVKTSNMILSDYYSAIVCLMSKLYPFYC
jgi:hypothetical protein